MYTKQLYLESLGCDRNTVDSEVMLGRLQAAGWVITQDPTQAETIVVNTCSFIEPAINESIDTILELVKLKKTGECRRLIVAGCLPERFREAIVSALPEVDVFIGTGAFDKIIDAAEGDLDTFRCFLPDPNGSPPLPSEVVRIQNVSHVAYLKISEGCNRHCTYCIIPKLRGQQRSRPVESIVSEARSLIHSGVKEIILVAQDSTAYGKDLRPPVTIACLIEALSEILDDAWLRVLYGHPESIDDGFIKTVADHTNVCSYFDIPVQHVSNRILQRMGRRYTEDDLYRWFDKIRTTVPDAKLRTTVITGFPGEKEADDRQLHNFVKNIRFDHLGVFIYSDSEDLTSCQLSGHVDKKTAQNRYDRLMSRQKKISLENNKRHIHQRHVVLVDESIEPGIFSGRTYFQAPDVDGVTTVYSDEPIQTGSFIQVTLTDAMEYDLVGKPIWVT
jgi:ribosomal protein S12 methylthiotransferase